MWLVSLAFVVSSSVQELDPDASCPSSGVLTMARARTAPRSAGRGARRSFPCTIAAMFERTALPEARASSAPACPGRARSPSPRTSSRARASSRRPGRRRPLHGAPHVQGHGRATRRPAPSARRSRAWAARSTPRPTANRPSTGSACRCREARRAMDVLGELIVRPTLERDRDRARAGRSSSRRSARYLDDPAEYCQILFQTAMFGDGPLGREICGDEARHPRAPGERDPRLLADELPAGQHGRRASPATSAHAEAVGARGRRVRDAATGRSRASRRRPSLPAGPRVRLGQARHDAGAALLGVPALRRDHPDSWTLAVLNTVLGDGMSSRLFLSVREERGLAYDVSSGIVDYADAGALEISRRRGPGRAAAGPRRDPGRARPAARRAGPRRRAGEGQALSLGRAGAAHGRDAPRRLVGRRPGGAARSGPDARRGARRGRRGRCAGRPAGRRARSSATTRCGSRPSRRPATCAASTRACGCRDDDADAASDMGGVAVDAPSRGATSRRARLRLGCAGARAGRARDAGRHRRPR